MYSINKKQFWKRKYSYLGLTYLSIDKKQFWKDNILTYRGRFNLFMYSIDKKNIMGLRTI